MMNIKNCLLIDWFSMSFRKNTVSSIIQMLDFDDTVEFTEAPYGYYGYQNRIVFGGISIHYNHARPEQDFPLLEMSGQGCRDFETYSRCSWDFLFQLALDSLDYHITRLDVAYDDISDDDKSGIIDIKRVIFDVKKRNYVSKFYRGILTNDFSVDSDAYSVMFGRRVSDIYIRIYDKARERGFNDGRHWTRVEVVFKQERALAFLSDPNPLGIKFRGVIYNYLRFVTPSKSDDNKSRWSIRKYWLNFLGDVEKISIFSRKPVDYNLSRLSHYVFHQAGNSIDTYIKCQGLISFLESILDRNSRLNAHQKHLIIQFRDQMNDKDVISDEMIDNIFEFIKT